MKRGGWQEIRSGGSGRRVWWRRRLPDGSHLAVTHDGGGTVGELPWVWRHRGPKLHPVLGTVINAQGQTPDPDTAKAAADRHAATLTHMTEQTALEV